MEELPLALVAEAAIARDHGCKVLRGRRQGLQKPSKEERAAETAGEDTTGRCEGWQDGGLQKKDEQRLHHEEAARTETMPA